MTEVATQTGSEAGTPAPAPASAPTPTVPAGYVPQADLDRERERSRGFQSELDRTKAALEAAQKPAPAAPAPATTGDGSVDVAALVDKATSEAVSRVFKAGELRDTAASLREQFPQVAQFDPTLFGGDRVAQFESADALKAYVEDVNTRLTQLLTPAAASSDAQTREALAAQAAGSAGPTGNAPVVPGMPSVEQVASMSLAEMEAFEAANPGVIDKLLAQAGAA